MEIESRIHALIAVGAAVSANCQPCLQSTVALAVESGAIEVGKRIRRGAASKMDRFASVLQPAVSSPTTADTGCGCGLI